MSTFPEKSAITVGAMSSSPDCENTHGTTVHYDKSRLLTSDPFLLAATTGVITLRVLTAVDLAAGLIATYLLSMLHGSAARRLNELISYFAL